MTFSFDAVSMLRRLTLLAMLFLCALLLFAPERISQAGITFGLMAMAIAATWVAARLTKDEEDRVR